ncbi:MAG: hypothetical protein A2Y40_07980 [Candidatus Margulisbacteria bacterium GWF2_35_9]|nr:MAG: hypothetical protein A2Y40_07980 [Candidatus Margulisbacteria bacterium GWF2_35_9]
MVTEENKKLTWTDFDKLTNKIIQNIHDSNIKFDAIIGIVRGGLFLAGQLSYKLDIKKVYTINTQLYADKQLISPKVLYFPKDIHFKNALVVDDILDTGATFNLINDLLKQISDNYHWAILLDKGKSNEKIDFIGQNINRDIWVEFPWN